jgi:hypothetical protein
LVRWPTIRCQAAGKFVIGRASLRKSTNYPHRPGSLNINVANKLRAPVSVMSNVAQIRERMPVISSDDRVIGAVSRAGTELWVTSVNNGCGFDHLIPVDWVEEVGSSVFLNKSRRFLEAHCANASREGSVQRRAA